MPIRLNVGVVMADELDQRLRALDAERARPEPTEPSVEDLLARVIATIHQAYKTPPDRKKETR